MLIKYSMSRDSVDAKYAFLVEWLDTQSALARRFTLFYHKADGALEMVKNI